MLRCPGNAFRTALGGSSRITKSPRTLLPLRAVLLSLPRGTTRKASRLPERRLTAMRRGLGHVTALSIMAVSLATAAAEQDGLYKADSPVTSLASSEVPAHNSSDQRFMLVEFYSAWCGHCQHFAPTYEELARVAKQRLPSLKVAAINCPTHEDACSEHKVSSFPTILLFPGSIRYPSHSRNVEAILAWVEQQRAATPQEAAVAAKEAAAQEAAAKKAADQRLEQVKREHERLMKQFEESTKKKAEAAAGSAAD